MITVKDIFNEIEDLNVDIYNPEMGIMSNERIYGEIYDYIPAGTLAKKILDKNYHSFTEKEIWVIAYELLKNKEYCELTEIEVNKWKEFGRRKVEKTREKLATNKSNSQPVLDSVKSAGKKLGDYYDWLKKNTNNKWKKEFFSKKYTVESAQAFINL